MGKKCDSQYRSSLGGLCEHARTTTFALSILDGIACSFIAYVKRNDEGSCIKVILEDSLLGYINWCFCDYHEMLLSRQHNSKWSFRVYFRISVNEPAKNFATKFCCEVFRRSIHVVLL